MCVRAIILGTMTRVIYYMGEQQEHSAEFRRGAIWAIEGDDADFYRENSPLSTVAVATIRLRPVPEVEEVI